MAIFNTHFYHELTKRYTIAFGSLFNDMQVVHYSENGDEASRVTVPLAYSNKEKFVQRLQDDPDHRQKPAIQLPRMAFELQSLNYDGGRKLQKLNKHFYSRDNGSSASSLYTPVPYDMIYSLYIVTKTQDDMLQIVEQILPGFAPDVNINVRGIGDPQTSYDVPISLLDVQPSDSYEGTFEDRRQIMWSMNFLMKAVYFGPVNRRSIILETDTPLLDYDSYFAEDGSWAPPRPEPDPV